MPAEYSILVTPLEDSSRPVVEPKQFPLLVRHLLDRFFNNEIVSVEGETLPLIMTIAWALALPTLVATILLFPAYHRFAPKPPVPPFWGQVADRYFFVMYEWVVMGGVTVFEWDLLFPNVLDVLVLSVLPIAHRRLLLARVAAVAIFLLCFLLGTSSLASSSSLWRRNRRTHPAHTPRIVSRCSPLAGVRPLRCWRCKACSSVYSARGCSAWFPPFCRASWSWLLRLFYFSSRWFRDRWSL